MYIVVTQAFVQQTSMINGYKVNKMNGISIYQFQILI
jgi:hypothetical protein